MKKVKLSSICNIASGGTPARSNSAYWKNGTIPWVKIGDITDKLLSQTSEHITQEGLNSSSAKLFPKGTILYTIFATLGEVAILNIAATTNQAIAGICLNDSRFTIQYLYYYLTSLKDYVNNIGRGVAQNNINLSILKNFEIPLRTLPEQEHIVESLTRVEQVIALRRAQLAKLDELVKCRFVELFGDPVLNEKAWPCENFSKYIEFITSGSRGWAKYYSDKGSYFITIKNVKKCNITTENVQYVNPPNNAEATRTKVEEGDLLISITADLGRTGVVTKEIAQYGAYINQHLTCVRIRKGCLHPVYVAHFLETDAGKMQFLSKNQNAVKAGLNFDAIKSIQLLIPPISEQKHFVSFLARIDKLRFEIQASLDKTQQLFDSLMQEYFG